MGYVMIGQSVLAWRGKAMTQKHSHVFLFLKRQSKRREILPIYERILSYANSSQGWQVSCVLVDSRSPRPSGSGMFCSVVCWDKESDLPTHAFITVWWPVLLLLLLIQFWEPSKFAATLRHVQDPSSGPVCVKMDMSAGHFSASDRYKYLKELAFDFAFMLDQLGLAK